MLPIKEIEEVVREKSKTSLSIIHAFGHLKRTVIGAKWFSNLLGGTKEDAEKAYVSGLLHDIYRPPSGRLHDESLMEDYKQAKEILEKFDLDEKLIEEITFPIREHREFSTQDNILCQSVFLADKILENMGAMVIFRRNMYLGENPDYVGVPLKDAMFAQYKKRFSKFKEEMFPKQFFELTKYQYAWPVNYFEAYKKEEEWAVYLSEYCYEKGKEKVEFDQAVKDFEPKFKKDEEYKKEALAYIEGSKFKAFERLLL